MIFTCGNKCKKTDSVYLSPSSVKAISKKAQSVYGCVALIPCVALDTQKHSGRKIFEHSSFMCFLARLALPPSGVFTIMVSVNKAKESVVVKNNLSLNSKLEGGKFGSDSFLLLFKSR